MKNYNSLEDYLNEVINRVLYKRQCGAFYEVVPEDEVKPKSSVKKLATQNILDAHGELAWENFYNQDQGRTPWCVAFTIAHVLSYILTAKYIKRITIEGNYIAGLLIDAGILTNEGASIMASVKYITKYSQNNGIEDCYGNLYQIGSCEAHERSSTLDLLLRGYPVVFGDMIGAPMCDAEYFLRSVPNAQASGHAFMGAPSKEIITLSNGSKCMNGENSWDDFGIPYVNGTGRSGQFHIGTDQLKTLFTPWIFLDVEKI